MVEFGIPIHGSNHRLRMSEQEILKQYSSYLGGSRYATCACCMMTCFVVASPFLCSTPSDFADKLQNSRNPQRGNRVKSPKYENRSTKKHRKQTGYKPRDQSSFPAPTPARRKGRSLLDFTPAPSPRTQIFQRLSFP